MCMLLCSVLTVSTVVAAGGLHSTTSTAYKYKQVSVSTPQLTVYPLENYMGNFGNFLTWIHMS